MQVLKDLSELEGLIRSEMERSTALWTDSEFEKIGYDLWHVHVALGSDPLSARIRAAVEAIYKVGRFDPEIMQKAERVSVPLVTFANRLPKAPAKSKKDVEEKKASVAASSSGGGAARATKGPKELYDRIERLEERVGELEVSRMHTCHLHSSHRPHPAALSSHLDARR